MATFNARAETVETKPFFRDAFKRTRCLIPISGYYEWQDTPNGKQPWYFTARDGSPALTTAGLWDEGHDRATNEILTKLPGVVGAGEREFLPAKRSVHFYTDFLPYTSVQNYEAVVPLEGLCSYSAKQQSITAPALVSTVIELR